MSRDSQVEAYIDADFSSGDSNRQKNKQLCPEENNNEVNELSKELSEMGCIVNAVKRPPNICVETCVYDSESEDEKTKSAEEDGYSDEFEEDKSEDEIEDATKAQTKSASDVTKSQTVPSSMKLTKSQSSMSHKHPGSVSGRSTTDYGSISVPATRRINMSFTNERLREIERHNHILLTKILSARNYRKSSIPPREQSAPRKPVPSAAVQRKSQQRQIDRDNMILLKKIQRAKSSVPGVPAVRR